MTPFAPTFKADTPATRFRMEGMAFKNFDASRRECEIRSHSPKVDHGREVVPRSAIEQDVDLYAANPLLTYCHNYFMPVGTCKDLGFDDEDRFGGVACFATGYEMAELAWALVSQEVVRQASIGYDVLEPGELIESWDDGRPAYVHKRIRVFEQSAVPLGMNEDTLVAVKALGFDASLLPAFETKGATSFADLPTHEDEARAWRRADADNRVRKWASKDNSGDAEQMDWPKYRKGFFWYDGAEPKLFGSYKLQFADVFDGELRAVWRGVGASMGALLGARGGVDIPDADRKRVYNHAARYYEKWDKEPPEFKGLSPEAWLKEKGAWPEFGDVTWHNGEKDIFAEAETLDNLQRVGREAAAIKGLAESTCNGLRHLLKAGRPIPAGAPGDPSGDAPEEGGVLSAADLGGLESARDDLDAVIRMDRDLRAGGPTGDRSEEAVRQELERRNALLARRGELLEGRTGR